MVDKGYDHSRGRTWSFVALALAELLWLALLSSCSLPPRGAKNWLFSIGPQTYAAALGDLDGDGDLDAFLANGENEVPVPNTVWLNDGRGRFSDSGQQIGERESRFVILEDIDSDGDLDALVSNTGDMTVYRNDGHGKFGSAWKHLGGIEDGNYVLAPAVGDINGDGYLDAMAGGCCGAVRMWDDGRRQVHPPRDYLWFSSEGVGFSDSGQEFDIYGTSAVALGDLDNDGDLDAFFANSGSNMDQSEEFADNQSNTLWFNDGQGSFSPGHQRLGSSIDHALALGDLDGDGDLDAFVGSEREHDQIWLNEGGVQEGEHGTFIPGRTVGQAESTRSVFLVDLDDDGDLEAFTVHEERALVWLNDGSAFFTPGQELNFQPQHGLALGDLDGDGSIDVFAGSVYHDILVWFNDGQARFKRQLVIDSG